MSCEVRLTERARRDLHQAAQWWAENRSAEQGARWYNGFAKAIRSLGHNHQRCQLAGENDDFPMEVRELHYGLGRHATHRAVFTVRPDMVLVLRIRHLAQDALSFDHALPE